MNPISAERCCNGYHRELRKIGERLGSEELGGEVPVDGENLMHVWVKDSECHA